jgi:hypothetical protein
MREVLVCCVSLPHAQSAEVASSMHRVCLLQCTVSIHIMAMLPLGALCELLQCAASS